MFFFQSKYFKVLHDMMFVTFAMVLVAIVVTFVVAMVHRVSIAEVSRFFLVFQFFFSIPFLLISLFFFLLLLLLGVPKGTCQYDACGVCCGDGLSCIKTPPPRNPCVPRLNPHVQCEAFVGDVFRARFPRSGFDSFVCLFVLLIF